MKVIFFIGFVFCYNSSYSQKQEHIQAATLGIHFTFTDFETATAIRNSSLSSVIRKGDFGKLQDMSQGLAISYGTGISGHYDLVTTLMGSFLTYPIPNRTQSGSESLLWEADASVRGKMFTDKNWFVPYLQLGVGVSKYQGYWGTFVPAGVGIQVSFFNEAFLIINSQYRIPITESANHHFYYSIGLVGNIGMK